MTALLALLAFLGPVIVHDGDERSPLGSVGQRPGTVSPRPVVYRRAVDGWVRWWLLYPRNDQDRGVLRTGRHAGDWGLVQVLPGARPCTPKRCDEVGECDTRESLVSVALPAVALLILVGVLRRRSSRDAEHPGA